MGAFVVGLTVFGVITYIAGAVIMMRVEYGAARAAACAPGQELEITKRASVRASLVLAPSLAALGLAFSAKDLVRGDATWQYMIGLELGLPIFAALAMYAASRWIYIPHLVFQSRSRARGYVPAGTWYDYAITCKQCGGPSDDLRAELAADAGFVWKCRRCGKANDVPASPCLTSASS